MKHSQMRDEAIQACVDFAKTIWGDQVRRGIMIVVGWLYAIPLFTCLMLCFYAIVFAGTTAFLLSVGAVMMVIVIGLVAYPPINRFAQRVEDRGGKDPVKALKLHRTTASR